MWHYIILLDWFSIPLFRIFSGSCTSDVADVLCEGTQTLNNDPAAKLPGVLTGCIIRDQVQVETLPVGKSVEHPNNESILGVRKVALTALQRRKKKVKESRSTLSSHLIDDDIDDWKWNWNWSELLYLTTYLKSFYCGVSDFYC